MISKLINKLYKSSLLGISKTLAIDRDILLYSSRFALLLIFECFACDPVLFGSSFDIWDFLAFQICKRFKNTI